MGLGLRLGLEFWPGFRFGFGFGFGLGLGAGAGLGVRVRGQADQLEEAALLLLLLRADLPEVARAGEVPSCAGEAARRVW